MSYINLKASLAAKASLAIKKNPLLCFAYSFLNTNSIKLSI